MRVAEMNWMQIEAQAQRDDRCVLPLGCVEQHAYLSLATDAILAEKVAGDAAEPLNVPVFPVLAYGMTPGFVAFPGTVSLRMSTYVALIEDMLEGFYRSGFRRIVLVNGHGGNAPVMTFCTEWMGRRPDASVKLHDWWAGPRFQAAVKAVDPAASHASWMENFPWTRLDGVAMPDAVKPPFDRALYQASNPAKKREILGDGNFHGRYQRSDNEMLSLWQVGVEETRAVIAENWP
ncbi:creatininase family protein [Bosea sp. 2YAB26]|uniref:creatininase family protein n=1 Tax=unclassified Bosea (in: a-proteobacteria) TaxID=2653178 RepID=UPI000853DBD0|nr:creatininase family protein [Bosea sp. BIWAKO-01]GAU81663.1 creatinine amidohydrolase [Bosea sp. BIWAKO-01]